MLMGNLTKLYYMKKSWITPKHPLYFESEEFKIHYAAAIVTQAKRNKDMEMEQNFELERLLKRGLGLKTEQVQEAVIISQESADLIDYLYTQTQPGRMRYLLMMDLYNVCVRDDPMSQGELDGIRLFARMMDVPEQYLSILRRFIECAYEEKEAECRQIYQQMEREEMGISLMELKYYLMTLYDTLECTQEELERHKELRLVDRCVIWEDLVLKPGMRLIFDHANVRIYGNISLEGGSLIIEHSRIVRKSDSHRACLNIRSDGTIRVLHSEIDCRNLGMFIRAQDGKIQLKDCEIYQTARGAAVRFWGKRLEITDCYFHHCYSPEDGGAVMMRGGGPSKITGSRFRHCEAPKGGAIYGVAPMEVRDCTFQRCYASEYGAAVYYVGGMEKRVQGLTCQECFPDKGETIQYITSHGSLDIQGKFEIGVPTILDCPVEILPQGHLHIHDAILYLKHPIRCRGYLLMERSFLTCVDMEQSDMIVLEYGKGCKLSKCRLDGMGKHGGIFAANTRLEAEQTTFSNMDGGRAIFNALSPKIKECTFNFCQDGGVHCQSGVIEQCYFVNCRAKSGAGVMMLGKKGLIQNCTFVRCISDITDGAVDRGIGNQVLWCEFQDCKPGH